MKIMKQLPIFFLISILIFCLAGSAQQKGEKEEKQELPEKYKKWLEEAIYIISQNEKEVFSSLRADEERENFIKSFWRRRDPTPETPFNEYREEHYRRIEYANKHFFEGRIGWRTDRGRVYIMFGPPDFFETNPGAGRGFLLGVQAGSAEFPSEVWTYRHIPGLKARISRIDFTFVDYYNSGSYQLTTNPALANALRNVSLPARYAGYDDAPLQDSPPSAVKSAQEASNLMKASGLEQLTLLAELTKSRGEVLEELEKSTRMRKLQGIVESKGSLAQISFVESESFFLGEGGLTYIPISIEVAAKDLGFNKVKDRYAGTVNFYIEVKEKDKTVYQSSDRLEMKLKEETYQRRLTDYYQYNHGLTLKPGEYFVHLVVWDEYNGNVGYRDKTIEVPRFTQKDFTLSEVILARDIQVVEIKEEEMVLESKDVPALKSLEGTDLKVPEKIKIKQRKGSPFTFGNLNINPNTRSEYPGNGELVFFYQIYNPTYDAEQKMTQLLIEHEIWKENRLVALVDKPQEVRFPIEQKVEGLGLNSGARFPLSELGPGKYTLLIRVKDIFSDKVLEKRVDFKVR